MAKGKGQRYAEIICRQRADGSLAAEWVGKPDALLRVALEAVDDGLVDRLPWPMVRVAVYPEQGVAIYRRAIARG